VRAIELRIAASLHVCHATPLVTVRL
jgi:hypothetical protein